MSEWPTTVSLTGLILGLSILWWRSGWKFTWLNALGRAIYSGYHHLPWRRQRVDQALALWRSAMLLGEKMTKVYQGQVGRGLTANEVADMEEQRAANLGMWEHSPMVRAACTEVIEVRCVRKALREHNPFGMTPSGIRFIAIRQLSE